MNKPIKMIGFLFTLIFSSIVFNQDVLSQSKILESVKRNPEEAKSMCNNFRELNQRNISASSKQSIQKISTQKNINEKDAEVLSMYVRGLNCPETF